jgi:hypothetical protein
MLVEVEARRKVESREEGRWASRAVVASLSLTAVSVPAWAAG